MHLGKISFGIYGSVYYLKEHGTPREPADLHRHKFVATTGPCDQLPHIIEFNKFMRDAHPAVHTNCSQTYGQLGLEGMGLVCLGCFAGANDPRLIRILPRRFQPHVELWLLQHPILQETMRVRTLVEFLSGEAAKDVEILAANQPNERMISASSAIGNS